MMPRDFPEYAALWREQIDPKELAELQAMATKIKRTAGQRWLLDSVLGLAAIGLFSYAILSWPASPLIKLCLALLLLVPMWFFWRRYQMIRASRALAVDDPKVFFESAIENVRAEINSFTLCLWMWIPSFIAALLLVVAARGFDHVYMNIRAIFTLVSVKAVFFVAAIPISIYLIRDHIRLRGQLRRLEAMRREWDERDPADEP